MSNPNPTSNPAGGQPAPDAPSAPAETTGTAAAASGPSSAGNLTFETNLVREAKAEPLEGHTVVVLERVGQAGEKFHSLLEPGDDRPRQGVIAFLLKKPNIYFAYAVDGSKHRLLRFSAPVQMSERAHSFKLGFNLWYRASDPQLLVAARTSDPLKLVRSKIVEVISAEMSDLPWTSVWQSFRAAADVVVAGTLTTLRAFARDYGIAINSLELRAEFSESAVAAEKEIVDIRDRTRVNAERLRAMQALKNERSDLRRGNAVREEEDRTLLAGRELQDVIRNETRDKVAERIRSANSLYEVAEVQRSIGVMPALPLYGLAPQAGMQAGASPLGLGGGHAAAALTSGADAASVVLGELVSLTGFQPRSQARRVRGAVLHVVAGVLAEDDTGHDSPELAAWAARARLAIQGVSSLAQSQADALQALADPAQLRGRLDPSQS
jgi:hypothetical protein